jgi:hypothetical protein
VKNENENQPVNQASKMTANRTKSIDIERRPKINRRQQRVTSTKRRAMLAARTRRAHRGMARAHRARVARSRSVAAPRSSNAAARLALAARVSKSAISKRASWQMRCALARRRLATRRRK